MARHRVPSVQFSAAVAALVGLLGSWACQITVVGNPPPGGTPVGAVPAQPPTGAPPTAPLPEGDGSVRYDVQRATLDVRDARTNGPIGGAEILIEGDLALKTARDGTVEVELPWGESRRVLVRHPGYVTGRDVLSQVGYLRRIVWLTPRGADTFASVVANGSDQVVKLGMATITIPAAALPAGTRVDFGILDDRAMLRPEGADFPGRNAPIALHQIRADVVGSADPWRFQEIIAKGAPIRVVLKAPQATLAALALGGKHVFLTAGASLDVVPDADVTLDMRKGEVRFPITHFSDVTVATDAIVEGGCGGQPVVMHFWRMTTKSSNREEGPFPRVRACGPNATLLRIEASLDVSTTVSGSWSTGVRDTERLELALLGGGKGKLFGQGLKVLAGYWRQQSSEKTTSAGGDVSVVSSSTIQVSRQKTCPASWACRGELFIGTVEEELEISHYSANLTALLGNEPGYSKAVSRPVTSCLTGRTSFLPGSEPDQEKILRYGEGLARWAQYAEADAPSPGGADAFIRQTIDRHRAAFQQEVFQTKSLRFAGSRIETQSIPPRCDRVPTGGSMAGDRDGGSPEGGGAAGDPPAETPPSRPETKSCADHPRSPLSPVPASSDPDGMIDRAGPVGSPTRFNAGGAVVTLELFAGPTATIPQAIEEVVWASACCPAESTQVRFSTQVQLNVAGTGSTGHGTLSWNGATWKAEAELGLELPLIGAQAVIGHDGRFAKGTGEQIQGVLRQIASVRRSSSETASAQATSTSCESQGVFAYFRRTEYSLRVTVSRGGQSQTQEIPLSASFYSSPFVGPKRSFSNHCARDFTHIGEIPITRPTTGIRDAGTPSPDGGASHGDAGAASLGCQKGPGCEACCETRAANGAVFAACRQTCQ